MGYSDRVTIAEALRRSNPRGPSSAARGGPGRRRPETGGYDLVVFFAVTVDRKLKHPAVITLCEAARRELFQLPGDSRARKCAGRVRPRTG
jgi:hypothetical protein